MFTPWPRLPTELKAKVLEHAVHPAQPIHYYDHLPNLERKGCLGTLIQTRNREVTQLSIEGYYKINTFVLSLDTTCRLSSVSFKLRRPRPRYAHMIRHLDFTLDCFLATSKTALIFFDRMHAWTFVFTAEHGLKAPTPNLIDFVDKAFIAKRATLWRDFDNLLSFKVSVTTSQELPNSVVWNAYSDLGTGVSEKAECFCDNNLPHIAKALRSSRLGFEAKKCTVTLNVPSCVNGACNTRLNDVLKGAVSTKN